MFGRGLVGTYTGARRVDIYSTANVPRNSRATWWNALYASRFAHVTFSPQDPERFEAELRLGSVGPLGIARVTTAATDIERSQHHIRRGGDRRFAFLMPRRAAVEFEHCGRRSTLQPGDFTLCDSAAPHRLHSAGDSELIVLRVSPGTIREFLPNPELWCGMRLPGDSTFARAAATMAEDLCQAPGVAAPFARTAAGNLLGVLATAVGLAFQVPECATSVVARRVRAQRHIDQHLADPALSPVSVAEALHISPRYLRMLFEGEQESVAGYIQRRRLEECARQLANPMLRGSTITVIALSHGFGSAAHFTRAFRELFHLTPSAYRRRHATGA